ncbi:hypothetical protein AAG570_000907 [Ranatra chinensis]|uniref:Uncharacterized protein n=1 Tax=Ranatra chinensis TaxID=642074 RepID=A0ABD0YYF6_9HEMI
MEIRIRRRYQWLLEHFINKPRYGDKAIPLTYWRNKSRVEGGWLLYGHTVRSVLSLCLMVVHMAEIGELVAANTPWLQPTVAASSWIAVQTFYHTIQSFGIWTDIERNSSS